MEKIGRTKIVDLLKREDFGAMVNVKGWVRTRRGSKQVNFIALNDGSTINNLQIVVDLANFDEEMLKLITTGACISVNGEMVESVGSAVISLCVNEAVDSFVTRPIFSQSAQVRHAARIQLQSDIEGAIESTKTPGVNAESVGVETAIGDNAITVTVTTSEGARAYVYAIDRTKLTATCPILEKYVGVFSPFNYPLKIVGA